MISTKGSKARAPLHIRLTARWAVVSLVIASASWLLARLLPASWVTAALKVVISSATAVGVTALLLWVIFSGVRLAFGKRNGDTLGSSGDVW